MNITITQGLGILLLVSGVILIASFSQFGFSILITGLVFVVLGIYLVRELINKKASDDSRFTPGNSNDDD